MKGTRIGRLLDDLTSAANAKHLSKLEIARRAGLHPNTLRHFRGWKSTVAKDKPAWNPSPYVIASLERVLLPKKRMTTKANEQPLEVTT